MPLRAATVQAAHEAQGAQRERRELRSPDRGSWDEGPRETGAPGPAEQHGTAQEPIGATKHLEGSAQTRHADFKGPAAEKRYQWALMDQYMRGLAVHGVDSMGGPIAGTRGDDGTVPEHPR